MKFKEEEWNMCPNLKTNFVCKLTNKGKWRIESEKYNKNIWGKCIFKIEPKSENTTPTFGDQRNFFTGLFEAEWENDNFIFEDGTSRSPQRTKKIKMFMDILEKIKERADIKDTPRGIQFYINKFRGGEKDEN